MHHPLCQARVSPVRCLSGVVCSNAKEDINLLQLQQLYDRVIKHHSLASGTATQQSFFQHWQQLAGGSETHRDVYMGPAAAALVLQGSSTHVTCCLLCCGADDEAQQMLQQLLQKSVAVAAAFVRDPKLYSSMDDDSDGEDASDSASIRSSSSSNTISVSSSSSSSAGA